MKGGLYVASPEQSLILREMQKGAILTVYTGGDGRGILKNSKGTFKNVRKVTIDILLKKGAIKPSILYLGVQSYDLTKLWDLNLYQVTSR